MDEGQTRSTTHTSKIFSENTYEKLEFMQLLDQIIKI